MNHSRFRVRVLGKEGFTLIELMIVVVIIGILAGVSLPKFVGMSKSAKEAEADPILKEVYTLQLSYYTRYNKFATAGELATHGFLTELSDATTANNQGRFYYISVAANTNTGSSATFCALADLTSKGAQNDLQKKNMGHARIISPGFNQSTSNCATQ